MKNYLLVFFFSLLFFPQGEVQAKGKKEVTIEINYGELKSPEVYKVNWERGLTAMEALQFVSEVSTHPVGKYVFVYSINKVEGMPEKTVWYYEINGEPAPKLAISQELKKGDRVTWIYKQDVCTKPAKK